MTNATRTLASLLLAFGVAMLAACGSDNDNDIATADLPEWFTPECSQVTGPAVASFSFDRGVTPVPNASPPVIGDGSITSNLVATSAYGGVLFLTNRGLHVSTDAGCSWREIAPRGGPGFGLTATDRYAYAVETGTGSWDTLYRFDPSGKEEHFDLPFWVDYLAATPADPGTIYVMSHQKEIFRSDDLGRTLVEQGTAPSFLTAEGLYINPRDSLHMIVIGHGQPGISFNGGVTWTESSGLKGDFTWAGSFSLAFGGADQGEVWLIGNRGFVGDPSSYERGLFRSLDGGLTFEPALMDGEGIAIGNGKELATAPGVFGEVWLGHSPGAYAQPARLHHYRAADDSLTTHYYAPEESCGFNELLFHPTDPNVLYLGREDLVNCNP